MSAGPSVNFTFNVPVGNTFQIVTQIQDFVGTILLNSSVSSIQFNIYAPGVSPLSGPSIASITPSPISSTYWYAYYNLLPTAALGVYTVQITGTTVSSFIFNDFTKFRAIPVDV